jgi:hypothetical protein
MRTVQLYVENQRIDLFQDEAISVTSSIQNISDLQSVFSDFSQTFTVPCTPNNSAIFEHYYNNDVDTTINHQNRRDARIEIDHIPFRSGRLQLEKSQIKEGFANNYQVSFYGDNVTLKDIIGETKIGDLDYVDLNHDYSGAEIQDRIEIEPDVTDYDVRYPLISSSRVWQYGDASGNDISITGGAIDYTELFPAVRMKSILDLIGTTFGITFDGVFLDSKRFTNAFMWFKNKESLTYYTPPKRIRFGIGNPDTDFLTESIAHLRYAPPYSLLTGSYDSAENIQHSISVEVSTGSSIDYFLDIYKDGVQVLSLSGNGSQVFNFVNNHSNYSGLDSDYSFYIRSTAVMTFSADVTYTLTYTLVEHAGFAVVASSNETDVYTETTPTSLTTIVQTDLQQLAPDMKVMDFLRGIFRTFNQTCYSLSSLVYRIEPLENFYNNGIEWNITPYVTTEEIEVNRPKLFKEIKLSYQQSQSFMNREFYDLFKREYSSLTAVFDYDGGDYSIELPFETLLHNQFTATDLQVAYCLGTEPEYKNYVPKPVILYMYEQKTGQSFKFDNGSTVDTVTDYMPFGQDVQYNSEEHSLNFGSEYSTLTLDVEDNSLYRDYYEPYLLNLYNQKSRQLNVTAMLPLGMLTNLKLNDTLIIRDKKYIINDMVSGLTSGSVKFNLISNWRGSLDYSRFFAIDWLSQIITTDYSVADDTVITIGSPLETQFATPDTSTIEGEMTVAFSCTSNTTGNQRTNTFPLTIVSRGITLPIQYIIIVQEDESYFIIGEDAAFTPVYITDESGNKLITE